MDVFNEMPISVGIDVPGKTALIVTFDCACQLYCYGCHFFKTKDSMLKITINEANEKIKKNINSGVIDCIVLTGGEVTTMPILYSYCKYLKNKYPDIDIVINTNGMNPSRIPLLLELGIIFHVDIKMSKENFDARSPIIGLTLIPDEYLKRLFMTLHYIYKDSSDKHILRTVDYPIERICPSDIVSMHSYSKSIEIMVNSLNSKYSKPLKWYLNDFYEI